MRWPNSDRGVSLIELTIGIVISGTVGFAIMRFLDSSQRTRINSALKSQTEAGMRAFMESTKKHISLSRNPYALSGGSMLNAPFQSRNCSFLVQGSFTMANCGDSNLSFRNLFIDRYIDAANPATYFTETLSTECVPAPAGVTIDAVNRVAITQCTPCTAGQVPVLRSRYSNRVGRVLRFSGAEEDPTKSEQADDGVTLASALCVTHGPLVNPTDPQSFQMLTLRLRTLVRKNQKQVRLLELTSVIPVPRPQPAGIRVLSNQN